MSTLAIPNPQPEAAGGPAAFAPGPEPLWQLFARAAARHAGRVAVTCDGGHLTYGELDSRAGELARRLRRLGVGPDVLVGVYLERSPEAIVALVAILKAGGAYLPLDPAYPSDRVAMILDDARPAVLIAGERLRGRLPAHSAHTLCLNGFAQVESLDGESEPNPAIEMEIEPGSGPAHLAYVIYTSGSTGKPKGVMVTQANVARLLSATRDWFHFNESDVWTLFHSLAFDFSVWEIWGCLLHGGRLVVVPFAISRSPEDFYDLLVREQVTVLNQTPSAFYQLMFVDGQRRSAALALRVVVFGGEALNFSALRPWFAAHGDRKPRLVNMYGITETTVHVTYREVHASDAEEGAPSLIGVPIPDMQTYLLGDDGQPVGDGETGEIYVGGAGVARGYLNRPELNAERFVPDPFSPMPNARLYRSGDLGRRLPGGEVEYLGRGDAQVKIHGFRIELGEIEAAIVGHPGIREARVIAHTDAAGTKRLAAYLVARGAAAPAPGELSAYLAGKLPPWMLPSVYVEIAAFPLTPNGKVDYAALPAPVAGSAASSALAPETVGQAPEGSREQQVAAIWRQVLGAAHVGVDDNFFDIGGTSLLLVSVHSKLQALLGRRISIAELFAATTVRALAARLGAGEIPVAGRPNASPDAAPDARPNAEPDAEFGRMQTLAQKQRAAFANARARNKAVS